MSRVDDLAERTQALIADLDDVAFDLLQEAVASGATSRPSSDRELQRARRALEKAADALRRAGAP